MSVEVCTPGELGPVEVAVWRELQRQSPRLSNPFLSATFAIAAGELDRLARVAVVRDGGELVGFVPFRRSPTGIARPLAPGVAGCSGVVTRAGFELDWRQLLRRCRVSVWELDHLVTTDAALPSRAPGVRRAATSVIELDDGFDAYVQDGMRRCKKYFNWLRRKRQRIELDLGAIRFDFATAGAPVLGRLVEWKSAQYRRSGWPDPFARPAVRELVERLNGTAEEDCAGSCSALMVGDELLAADFSLRSASVYAGWFVTYNRAFERWSPGAVRWLYVAQACAEAGISVIDLGCGDEEYKQKLATRHDEVLEGHLCRATPRAAVRLGRRLPADATRRLILSHPRLRATVRTTLRRVGSLRVHEREVRPSGACGTPGSAAATVSSAALLAGDPAGRVGSGSRPAGTRALAYGDRGDEDAMVAADAGGGPNGQD